MLTPAEAEAAIAAHLAQAPEEELSLPDCAGRVLRETVRAERDSPPFDRVTMDGIALHSAAFAAGRREFRIAGVQPAGAPPQRLPDGADCLEVMTGAVLPSGCDAVVPIEALQLAGGVARLAIAATVQAWDHVHRRASDCSAGTALLESGQRLRGPEIAVAASAGRALLRVSRLPRICVVSTGDELVDPGGPVHDHQLRRSNPQALAAALRLAGFPACTDRHLADDPVLLGRELGQELARHEVLVLSGGVSAGSRDYVPGVLESLGVQRVFHKVAQRPGKPMWFGVTDGGTAVFALPGNPVSALVCLSRYVVPALRRGAAELPPTRELATLAQCWESGAPLSCFLPVGLEYDGGRLMAVPRPTNGSGDLTSLAGTDGFIELPPGPASHPAGTVAPLYRWVP